MRPTCNQFISPKCRTGEYLYPLIRPQGQTTFEATRNEPLTPKSNFNREPRFKKTYGSIYVMSQRTKQVGPGEYNNQPEKTILQKVNQSHHVTNMPLVGLPYPKETTKQLFGNLLLDDPTFATQKFKREQRQQEKETEELTKERNALEAQSKQLNEKPHEAASGTRNATLVRSPVKSSRTLDARQMNGSQNNRYGRSLRDCRASARTSNVTLNTRLKFSGSRQQTNTASTGVSTKFKHRPMTANRERPMHDLSQPPSSVAIKNANTRQKSLTAIQQLSNGHSVVKSMDLDAKQRQMTIFNEQPSSSKYDENSEAVAAISPPNAAQPRLNQQSEAALDKPNIEQSEQDQQAEPASSRVNSAPSRAHNQKQKRRQRKQKLSEFLEQEIKQMRLNNLMFTDKEQWLINLHKKHFSPRRQLNEYRPYNGKKWSINGPIPAFPERINRSKSRKEREKRVHEVAQRYLELRNKRSAQQMKANYRPPGSEPQRTQQQQQKNNN